MLTLSYFLVWYIFIRLLFLIYYLSIFFFFFFQAEDGIRDVAVTGVQTCALPISGPDRGICRCLSFRVRGLSRKFARQSPGPGGNLRASAGLYFSIAASARNW